MDARIRSLLGGDKDFVGACRRALLLGEREVGTGIWSLMQGDRKRESVGAGGRVMGVECN